MYKKREIQNFNLKKVERANNWERPHLVYNEWRKAIGLSCKSISTQKKHFVNNGLAWSILYK